MSPPDPGPGGSPGAGAARSPRPVGRTVRERSRRGRPAAASCGSIPAAPGTDPCPDQGSQCRRIRPHPEHGRTRGGM